VILCYLSAMERDSGYKLTDLGLSMRDLATEPPTENPMVPFAVMD
jgi:hypothetical protein